MCTQCWKANSNIMLGRVASDRLQNYSLWASKYGSWCFNNYVNRGLFVMAYLVRRRNIYHDRCEREYRWISMPQKCLDEVKGVPQHQSNPGHQRERDAVDCWGDELIRAEKEIWDSVDVYLLCLKGKMIKRIQFIIKLYSNRNAPCFTIKPYNKI